MSNKEAYWKLSKECNTHLGIGNQWMGFVCGTLLLISFLGCGYQQVVVHVIQLAVLTRWTGKKKDLSVKQQLNEI